MSPVSNTSYGAQIGCSQTAKRFSEHVPANWNNIPVPLVAFCQQVKEELLLNSQEFAKVGVEIASANRKKKDSDAKVSLEIN